MLRDERVVAAVVDHELERQSFRVGKDERAVVRLAADAVVPEVEGLRRGDAERNAVHHARARATRRRVGILEERDVGARGAALVRVEEVVDGRVVLVDRLLDEAEAERAGVELDVARRVAGDAGHVVDAFEPHAAILRTRQR